LLKWASLKKIRISYRVRPTDRDYRDGDEGEALALSRLSKGKVERKSRAN